MNKCKNIPLLFLLTGISCSHHQQKQISQPNILVAIADDWSYGHSSFDGYPEVKTPAFDEIAKEGIYFKRAYCSTPSCTPSRATVLTGKNGWELEQGANLWGYLPQKFPIYTDILQENGYFVGYTGKGWAPGNLKACGRTINPVGEAFNKIRKEPVPKLSLGLEGISDIDYAENFKEFLDKKPDGKPFCFWYGGSEPHRSYSYGIGKRAGKDLKKIEVPEFLPNDSATQNDIADYLFEVEWFDSHLSKILKLLEERGELENTLVIVTSDNGMPFPRAKANNYEYGVHMPLAVMWKSKIKGGRQVNDFVSLIDFAPTFLEAARVEIPKEMTGKSLMPVLLSKKPGQIDPKRIRTFSYKERHAWVNPGGEIAPFRSIRKNDWLLIWNMKPDMWPAGNIEPAYNFGNCAFGDVDEGPSKTQIIQLAEKGDSTFYRTAFMKRAEYELYDVIKDPYQLNNLVGDTRFQNVLGDLKKELVEYLILTHDPRIEGRDSVFVKAPYFGKFYGTTQQ